MKKISNFLFKFLMCSFVFGFFFVLKVEAADIKSDASATCVYRRYIYTGVDEGTISHITVRMKYDPTKQPTDNGAYKIEVYDDLKSSDIPGIGKIMDFGTDGIDPAARAIVMGIGWNGMSNVLRATSCGNMYQWIGCGGTNYQDYYAKVTPHMYLSENIANRTSYDYAKGDLAQSICPPYAVVSVANDVYIFYSRNSNVYVMFEKNYSDAKDTFKAMIAASPQLSYMANGLCGRVGSYVSLKPTVMAADDTDVGMYKYNSYTVPAFYYRGYDINNNASDTTANCKTSEAGWGANVYLEILPLVKVENKASNVLTADEARAQEDWLEKVARSLYVEGSSTQGLYNTIANAECSSSKPTGKDGFDCQTQLRFAINITYNAQARLEDLKSRGFEKVIKDYKINVDKGYSTIQRILQYNELLLKMVKSGLLKDLNKQRDHLKDVEKAYKSACDSETNPDAIISQACKQSTKDYIQALKDFEQWAKENNISADMYYNVLDSVGIAAGMPLTCQDFYVTLGTDTNKLNILTLAFSYVKIIAPILAIILGMVDFAKAALAADDEGMKKASSNFIKRLVAAVILFIIPFILQVILDQAAVRGFFDSGAVPQICVNENVK